MRGREIRNQVPIASSHLGYDTEGELVKVMGIKLTKYPACNALSF